MLDQQPEGNDPLKLLKNRNWLCCINPQCVHKTPLLQERDFKCPDCGALYDIIHPEIGFPNMINSIADGYNPLSKHAQETSGSHVWAWKDFILPGVANDDIVTLGEQLTLVKAGQVLTDWIGGDLDLRFIHEGLSPSGSFKDYGMTVKMTIAKLAGVALVGCASTGDTSAAIAAYAAAAGIPCFVLVPKGKVTVAQLVQPRMHGAIIIEVPGDFDDCNRILVELVAEGLVYPGNSRHPGRIEGHQATVFNSFLRLGKKMPDWFVLPLGNGSNTSSIGKGQRALETYLDKNGGSLDLAKILAVQPLAAAPLANSFITAGGWDSFMLGYDPGFAKKWLEKYEPIKAGNTIATATQIGDPTSWFKVMREINHCGGGVTSASDADARSAMFAAGAAGFEVCPQTGVALAGLHSAVEQGYVRPGSQVVVLATAHGLKFTDVFLPENDESFTTTLDDTSTNGAVKVLEALDLVH